MQFTWTADDIRPGIIVGKPHRAERWMIGYATFVVEQDHKYTLNSMADGMVNGPYTREELAEQLTENNEHPAVILDHRFGG